jgi:hypothetical protein
MVEIDLGDWGLLVIEVAAVVHRVIPAKAGIQTAFRTSADSAWIPAFAGMTPE